MVLGARGPWEGCEPLSSLIHVLEVYLTVIWEMNLGAVGEGSVQRLLNYGDDSGSEM